MSSTAASARTLLSSSASTRRFEVTACGCPLEPTIVDVPEPEGREVLLRVLAAGLCHTDLHLCDGYFDLGDGKRIALADRGIRLPHTLGHENVGEVVAMGPDAAGVAIGDRVLVYPWIGCDACARCASGEGQLCASPRFLGVFRAGGFGDHLVVPDASYLFSLDGLPAADAAPLACSGLTAYSALMKIHDAIRKGPIVILGAGGLGLMCLALLARLDANGAIVIDPNENKRKAARDMGALAVFGNDEVERQHLTEFIGEGVDAVVDFVGSPESIGLGIASLRKGGRLVVVGMHGGALTIPIPNLVLNAIAIEGSYVGSIAEMRELMTLVRRTGLPELPITRRPLTEINDAFAALRAGSVVGRTVLQP